MSSDATAVAALFLAGHALGDFAFQSRWMIERKSRVSGLLSHGAVVALCHVVALLPYLTSAVFVAILAVVGAHVLLDAGKSALARRFPKRSLEWFFLDQFAHLVVLAFAWNAVAAEALPLFPNAVSASGLAQAGLLVAAYAFNLNGVSSLVVGVLARTGIASREGGPSAGRVIGYFERAFALTLILNDQWAALGLLVTAKSLARFKELENREMAEYYLVGTLASLLGATVTAIAVRFLLAHCVCLC